jgi:hypothetical protein
MLCEQIIGPFEKARNAGERFDLKQKLREIFDSSATRSSSPIRKPKVQMKDEQSLFEKIKSLREAILFNLLLNDTFDSKLISASQYGGFIQMLKQKNDDEINENSIVQHICAHHLSKMDISYSEQLIEFLGLCSTIKCQGFNQFIMNKLEEMQSKLQLDIRASF